MTKIAIMLPIAYRGGTLQATKIIAKAITHGAKQHNLDLEVVFSYLDSGGYNLADDFSELLDEGIELRATNWEKVSSDFIFDLPSQYRPAHIKHKEYCLPRDGANDFFDCDLWVIISDRLEAPLLPVKPYCLVIYDYLQRYEPSVVPAEWHQYVGIPVNREAVHTFVTTPSTRQDLISYIGVSPSKITMLNLDFNPTFKQYTQNKRLLNEKYFLWVTNLAIHKNHMRSIKAIERFFDENDEFHAVITGAETHYFYEDEELLDNKARLNLPQVTEFRKMLSQSKVLRDRVHIFGMTPSKQYLSLLRNAEFLFHSAVNDNGTFSVIEAAYFGVPAISSRYPAMEHIQQLYGLDLHWFDPYDINDMSKQLQAFAEIYQDVKIPDREQLNKLDWHSNADTLVETLSKIIKRRR